MSTKDLKDIYSPCVPEIPKPRRLTPGEEKWVWKNIEFADLEYMFAADSETRNSVKKAAALRVIFSQPFYDGPVCQD